MENTIKFMSLDKSCRFSIINHAKLNEKKELQDMSSNSLRNFTIQLLANSILLSAVNSHSDKISFSFRFSADCSIFCEVNSNKFFFTLSDGFMTNNCQTDSLIKSNSILSVTKGDWNTGLHTGSVLISDSNPKSILTHYANQSEQLNVAFVSCKAYPNVSLIVQPLPFATKEQLTATINNLFELLQKQTGKSWSKLITDLKNYGTLIEKNELIL